MQLDWMRSVGRRVVVLAAAVLGLGGCAGTDLGECDVNALGGSMDPLMPMPHTGQAQIDQSCAVGQCHSLAAKGEARMGVPAGLNFDLVPLDGSDAELTKVSQGTAKVDELAEEMWAQIEAGTMPPEGKRAALTADQKETVRNWLACGAPVINRPPAAPVDADWNTIFTMGLGACSVCHGATPVPGAGAWYVAGNACQTRQNLLGNAIGSMCGGMGALVVPSNPDGSIMLSKLEDAVPICGDVMPVGRMPNVPNTIVTSLRAWIAGGALAPGCP